MQSKHPTRPSGGTSSAELAQDLVDADTGPDGHRIRRTPLARAARWDDAAGADQPIEIGGVGIERCELRDRSPRRGDDGSFAGRSTTDGIGQVRAQFPNAGLSCVHMCTQPDLYCFRNRATMTP